MRITYAQNKMFCIHDTFQKVSTMNIYLMGVSVYFNTQYNTPSLYCTCQPAPSYLCRGLIYHLYTGFSILL